MAECPKLNGEKERKVKRKKCEKSMKVLLQWAVSVVWGYKG